MDQQIKVDLLLSDYEEVAAQAVDNGIDLTTQVFFFYALAAFSKKIDESMGSILQLSFFLSYFYLVWNYISIFTCIFSLCILPLQT